MREFLRRVRDSIAAESLLVIAVCGYCIIVFFSSLNLASLRFDVPLRYNGDALQYSYMMESWAAPGGLGHIENSGAPFSTQNLDFPNADVSNLLIAENVAGNGEFGRRFNLFFLVGALLTTLTGYLVARSMSLNPLWSAAVAVCFTLLPFHFLRIGHLFYTNYSAAAIGMWLCVRIGAQRKTDAPPNRWKGALSMTAFALACIWCGSTGVYYAFFTCIIVAVSAVATAVHRRNRYPLLLGGAALSIIALCTIAQIVPTKLFETNHGKNDAVAKRSFPESEVYGLRISQLLLPTLTHPVAQFAKVRRAYDSSAPAVNENQTATLGLAGSLGFLLAIALLLLPDIQRRLPWEIRLSALLVLAMLLYATIGGFGSLFALLITPQIRALNRISPFIGYASLIVGAGVLQQFFNKENWRLAGGIVALLAIPIATYDQATAGGHDDVVGYERNRKSFDADKKFAATLASKVPKGSNIMQLPFVNYPESGSPIEYAQFRNNLHAPQLHWTYGAMKGRPESNWLKLTTLLNPELFAQAVNETGFAAIVTDNRVAKTAIAALLKDLLLSPGLQKIDSEDGTQTAYVFAPEPVARARAMAPARGWYDAEADGTQTWVWASGDASIELSATDRRSGCVADISLTSIRARKIDAIVDGTTVGSLTLGPGDVGHLNLTLDSTVSRVDLHTDVPGFPPSSNDPRALSFGWRLNRPPTCVFEK